MLLEGMEQDEDVPFRYEEQRETGPRKRENVDAGTDVINITKFREELEADRKRRQGGGD